MNLVFQAVILLAFLLPGLLFRSAYKTGFWNYPLGRLGPFSDQIPRSIVHAAWINTLWAGFIYKLGKCYSKVFWKIDYSSVIYWLTNNFGKDQKYFDNAVASLTQSPLRVFSYFFGLYCFSVLCGWVIYGIVRKFKWDRKYVLLRFDNDWHYQLRGEILDFPDYARRGGGEDLKYEDVEATIIVAVVDLKDRSYLYSGILIDFFFDQAGNLDRLLLVGAMRRDFTKDTSDEGDGVDSEGRWYKIRGHYFSLRMSEIKTLNFDYPSKQVKELAIDTSLDLDLMLEELDSLFDETDAAEQDLPGGNASSPPNQH